MPRITLKIIEKIYDISKQVYFSELSFSQGVDYLVNTYDMNKNSMADYIYAFKHLMDGEEYTRTISYDGTKFYLENILKDFGIDRFNKALTSVRLHISYYESLQNITMKKQRKLLEELEQIKANNIVYPDEISSNEVEKILEGTKKQVLVNIYERDTKARQACLDEFGYTCKICSFDFEKKYGKLGREFIHVHHLIPLSEIKGEYVVNPIKDLIPVCPNCHAMLHRKVPAYKPEYIKKIINN
ncbi:HNH endonuclease [Arcobacter sp. YIC-80]|uniref:HNH endonuclease n=1 Tax=Arcobacter sp. YIC-80 TaxID=3376683 RepID=UPI00384ED63B